MIIIKDISQIGVVASFPDNKQFVEKTWSECKQNWIYLLKKPDTNRYLS